MIYCVEDDDSIRELMLYALRASGFEAEGFRDSVGLFDALSHAQPQLIMLDIMLPGMDGIEILKALRGNPATARIPVIIASARGTEYDKVVGLDLGADDYLAKPFGMMEMVSRIRAVLRRAAPAAAPGLLQMGNLRMDSASHTVYAGDTRVELTLKEFELLKLFLEHPAGSLPGISCWSGSGARTMWARPGRWTYTSAPCARSWGSAANTSAPSGALATGWRRRP